MKRVKVHGVEEIALVEMPGNHPRENITKLTERKIRPLNFPRLLVFLTISYYLVG